MAILCCEGVFEELYRDPQRLEQFVSAVAGISLANFESFAEKFDCTPYRTMCDVGGAVDSYQWPLLAVTRTWHARHAIFLQ